MKKFGFVFGLAVLLAVSGCVSTQDVLSESDLTLTELEKKINQATDSDGLFAASNSYIMRQEVAEKHLLDDDEVQMVEVKFERPDRFALTTYKDNQIATVFCTDGKSGWVADYGSRKTLRLDENALRRMQMLASLGRPNSGGYSAIFKKVEVHRCSNQDGKFYRIDCYGLDQEHPVYFYVDAEKYLLRKVKMTVVVGGNSFDYENHILDYERRNGVLIPMKTRIKQLGAIQESKVIHYQLNPVIPASDFQPPVF